MYSISFQNFSIISSLFCFWWIFEFFMEIMWRFKCLMVESKCLVSRVIALYASAQLNKWYLQLIFLDFRKTNLANIFRHFFKVFKVEKPYFFVRRPTKILVIIRAFRPYCYSVFLLWFFDEILHTVLSYAHLELIRF